MSTQNDLSFNRWQDKSIEQFGFTNNLFIALASGFMILEAQSAFRETTLQPYEAWLVGISIILMFASLTAGGILAINRLLSFRNTAQTARKRETKNRQGIDKLRDQTENIDTRSWRMLWSQTGLFAVGSLFLLIVVVHNLLGIIISKGG